MRSFLTEQVSGWIPPVLMFGLGIAIGSFLPGAACRFSPREEKGSAGGPRPRTLRIFLLACFNGFLYFILVKRGGFGTNSLIDCLAVSGLLVISLVDWKTFEIPVVPNRFLFGLGLLHLAWNWNMWPEWLLGFFAVSVPLALLFYGTGGRAVGGGDVKLMASCGLLVGWKGILLAFFSGCVLASLFHLFGIIMGRAGRFLAMGPYLSMGVFLSMVLEGSF